MIYLLNYTCFQFCFIVSYFMLSSDFLLLPSFILKNNTLHSIERCNGTKGKREIMQMSLQWWNLTKFIRNIKYINNRADINQSKSRTRTQGVFYAENENIYYDLFTEITHRYWPALTILQKNWTSYQKNVLKNLGAIFNLLFNSIKEILLCRKGKLRFFTLLDV